MIFKIEEILETGNKFLGYFKVPDNVNLPTNGVALATMERFDPGMHRFDPYPPEKSFRLLPTSETRKTFLINQLTEKEDQEIEVQNQETYGGEIPENTWFN